MHNRQALKHWRRHGGIKLEHRDDIDRVVAQFLIKASVLSECGNPPRLPPNSHSETTSQDLDLSPTTELSTSRRFLLVDCRPLRYKPIAKHPGRE